MNKRSVFSFQYIQRGVETLRQAPKTVSYVATSSPDRLITCSNFSAKPPSVYSVVKSRRRLTAFTLVELMTVIVILAVVAGIGLPALLEILSGNGQTQASGQVSAAVQRARSLALQLNTPVALVFFEETGYTGQTGMAYEIAEPGQVSPSTNLFTLYFVAYPQVPVQYLPSGMYVAAFVGSPAVVKDYNSNNLNVSFPFCLPSTANPAPYAAIVFDSHGQMALPQNLWVQMPDQSTITTSNTPTNELPNCYPVPAICIYQPGSLPASDTTSSAVLAAYLVGNSDLIVFNTFTGSVIK